MDINEVSTQISLINALLSDFDKKISPCANKKDEKKEEETQDAMPDSTTNTEKNNPNPFHCGDDVFVLHKDGRYYFGTIVELSTSNDNDSCEVGTGVARCKVKFGDGTQAWAPVTSLKLLSATPTDDGRIMCVVCKRREAAGPAANAIVACDMCGRGYHAKCHTPPVDTWINGASWHCKRCVDQRYRVAAAENRALKRSDLYRFKQQRRQHQELTQPCDTGSTTSSTNSEVGKDQNETHCYCGEKSDWMYQMLLCCRCSRWFHQRCVSSLQYPLYAGDELYIFACAECNGGTEYLRRLELCWLELAHLALYNLTTYNAPNYFDLDSVIMPYIMDNWHALQLPEKMWRTPVNERREKILTALTSSRKRFKCGREMKKRATIWGLRSRNPPPQPMQLSALEQMKRGAPLTDAAVRAAAPRLRFLPPQPSEPSSSNSDKSSYRSRMIVPFDCHWLNLMTGKRFHENLNSNSNSENDSTSSYESVKQTEADEQASSAVSSTARKCDTKADIILDKVSDTNEVTTNEAKASCEDPVPSLNTLIPCSVKLDKISKETIVRADAIKSEVSTVNINTTKIATMNLEISKLSTKNIIEHSKIMSLQQMESAPTLGFGFELESSGDETSSRGTLDVIIPPLKDFQGKNNPFLMQNTSTKKQTSTNNLYTKHNSFHSRFSLPIQLNPFMPPIVRPTKRKLSEKDIVIGPNGEVKRRKYRRPRKYLQLQLNKSCPLPEESGVPVGTGPVEGSGSAEGVGRRLRQRQERNYCGGGRRGAGGNCSVRSLQLGAREAADVSALKCSVQRYFRAGRAARVLARRRVPGLDPAYLIEWDSQPS